MTGTSRAIEIEKEPEDSPRLANARPRTLERSELADLELLLMGAYAPLASYCDAATTRSIETRGTLEDGTPFPAPVLLRVDRETRSGDLLALRNTEGVILALLEVTSTFPAPSTDPSDSPCAAGTLKLVRLPHHADFPELRAVPGAVAASDRAYYCDDLPSAAELAAIASAGDSTLVLIPSRDVPAGDLRHFLRVKTIVARMRAITPPRKITCIVVPEVRRELRPIVARAFGAAEMLAQPAASPAAPESAALDELRERILPPAHRRGVTIWLTGLSQSGKSTIAAILTRRLLDFGRGSTLLDGDIVRTHLSKGLTFSREDRDLNIRRIGFVAGEITRHGGTVVVAAIAPYKSVRAENQRRIGDYIEVFVNAPVDVCEKRDQKGQYARARRGEIKGFTGVDDPYEPPAGDPSTFVECRTDRETPQQSAEKIVERLLVLGYLRPADEMR